MPTYDYRCAACDAKYEAQGVDARARPACPACGARRGRRLPSVPAVRGTSPAAPSLPRAGGRAHGCGRIERCAGDVARGRS